MFSVKSPSVVKGFSASFLLSIWETESGTKLKNIIGSKTIDIKDIITKTRIFAKIYHVSWLAINSRYCLLSISLCSGLITVIQ